MTFVIMMNGYTGSLKSTMAKKLSKQMKLPLIATYRFGTTLDKTKRANGNLRIRRYRLMCKEADYFFQNKTPIILDACFNLKKYRKMVYSRCKQFNVKNVVLIRCICSDIDLVKLRLQNRKKLKGAPEKDCFRLANYLYSVYVDEPPFQDKIFNDIKPSIIYFDSAKFKIISTLNPNPATKKVKKDFYKVIKTLIPDKDFKV